MIGQMAPPTRQSSRGSVTETHFGKSFENSPIPTYEQDYTRVAALLQKYRDSGVTDIIEYLDGHPDDLEELTAAVLVRSANRAAVETFAYDPANHDNRIPFASKGARRSFLQQVAAVWHGRSAMHYEFTRDPGGAGPTNCSLHWSAPETPTGPDFSRVVISIADVAERHGLAVQLQQQADQLTLLQDIKKGISSIWIPRRSSRRSPKVSVASWRQLGSSYCCSTSVSRWYPRELPWGSRMRYPM